MSRYFLLAFVFVVTAANTGFSQQAFGMTGGSAKSGGMGFPSIVEIIYQEQTSKQENRGRAPFF